MGWVAKGRADGSIDVRDFRAGCDDDTLLDYAMRQPHAAILDGSAWHTDQRWHDGDLLLCFSPHTHYRFTGDAWIGREGERDFSSHNPRPFLDMLHALVGSSWQPQGSGAQASPLPVGMGWVCFASYDLAPYLEPTVGISQPRHADFPLFVANRYRFALIRSRSGKWQLMHSDPSGFESMDALHERLLYEVARHRKPASTFRLTPLQAEWSRHQYDQAFARLREHILAGDIYQANLTQRYSAKVKAAAETCAQASIDAPALYRELSRVAQEPYSCFFACGDGHAILSSSPECFLRLEQGHITTRPIKGTRPAVADAAENARLAAELLASPKDRAELTMIVDLERNDLGRICEVGSIQVPELFAVDRYRHVHHLLATVQGKLAHGAGFSEMLGATFPGGSISGAPKLRALQILRELEPHSRGPYTGSIFALAPDGSMQSNILIRTLLVAPDAVSFSVGGGIVADSQCDAEYEECRSKARGMALALSRFCDVGAVLNR